jgi:hypothetical protein
MLSFFHLSSYRTPIVLFLLLSIGSIQLGLYSYFLKAEVGSSSSSSPFSSSSFNIFRMEKRQNGIDEGWKHRWLEKVQFLFSSDFEPHSNCTIPLIGVLTFSRQEGRGGQRQGQLLETTIRNFLLWNDGSKVVLVELEAADAKAEEEEEVGEDQFLLFSSLSPFLTPPNTLYPRCFRVLKRKRRQVDVRISTSALSRALRSSSF